MNGKRLVGLEGDQLDGHFFENHGGAQQKTSFYSYTQSMIILFAHFSVTLRWSLFCIGRTNPCHQGPKWLASMPSMLFAVLRDTRLLNKVSLPILRRNRGIPFTFLKKMEGVLEGLVEDMVTCAPRKQRLVVISLRPSLTLSLNLYGPPCNDTTFGPKLT